MESSEKLPETLQDLEALRDELLDVMQPLHEKMMKAVEVKEKKSFLPLIKPPAAKLKAVFAKIEELEKTGSDSVPKPAENAPADASTSGESAPKPAEKSTADASISGESAPKPAEKSTADASTWDEPVPKPAETANADASTWDEPVPKPAETANADASARVDPNTSEKAEQGEPWKELESDSWRESEPNPSWINPDVQGKKPYKSHPTEPAILRFVAGGTVHCFGHTDRGFRGNIVQVFPIMTARPQDSPYYGIRVKFPRTQMPGYDTLFNEENWHTVFVKFHPKSYTNVEDRVVSDQNEFEDFLQTVPQHAQPKVKEAFGHQCLYRITFTYEENGIELAYYPNQYSSSVAGVQDIYNVMQFITQCKTLSVYVWKYPDLPAHLHWLYGEQHSYVYSFQPYLHKYKDGWDAYVEWGKIIVPPLEKRFERMKTFRRYPDYHIVVGNGEAREKMVEVNLMKELRNRQIKMSVIQAGPDDSSYVALMHFQDFKDFRKVIISAGKGLITWEPAPIVKPQRELAQGEAPAEDKPDGWSAWLIIDASQRYGADLLFFLLRPTDNANKYKNKSMPPVPKPGDVLKSQMVYFKIRSEVKVTKRILLALNLLRFKNTQGIARAEQKRAILCGSDQTVYRVVDILEGLSEVEIAGFVRHLTPSQEAFITRHCRKIMNGICILQGPAGSGKTSIIKILVQIAHKRRLKIAIVTDSNSAADNVIDKVADKKWIAVRIHSSGLERRHLLKHSREGIDEDNLLPADPGPDDSDDSDDDGETLEQRYIDSLGGTTDAAESEKTEEAGITAEFKDDAANTEGWKDADPIVFSDFMLKSALDHYNNAKAIMSPEDPRMKNINSALFTWILKILGAITTDEESPEVKAILDDLATYAPFEDLRDLMFKSQRQKLDKAEWARYGNAIEQCTELFIGRADVVVATIAQLTMEWAKDIHFDWKIVDEATMISDGQFVAIWGDSDLMVIVGDQRQLGKRIMSKPTENPFNDQLRYGLFVRFVENNWPYFMLRVVMRSTAGLEVVCSELFYQGLLKPGEGTALVARPTTRLWQKETRALYPALKEAPTNLAYPICLNITSESEGEAFGTSFINRFNASAVMDHVVWLVENGIARTNQIGIATPYAGQVSLYLELFRQLDKSKHQWQLIRVGSTGWWQGGQAKNMIVDLVRGSNDQGNLGFVSDGHRLNVLLSRQEDTLTIVGDRDCTKIPITGDDQKDKKILERRNDTNRYMIKLFKWMENKGRLVEIRGEPLYQKYEKMMTAALTATLFLYS